MIIPSCYYLNPTLLVEPVYDEQFTVYLSTSSPTVGRKITKSCKLTLINQGKIVLAYTHIDKTKRKINKTPKFSVI